MRLSSSTPHLSWIAATSVAAIVLAFLFCDQPPAAALSNPCALDSHNLVTNGSMAAANPDYGVAAGWNAFVLGGSPVFEHVGNEQIDPNGSQYIWQDISPYDAGIYQTVTNLAPGAVYHFWLGYALAAYDPGTMQNERGNWIGRQVGYDRTGGTSALSPQVVWSNVVWNGGGAVNLPDLSPTFTALTDRATLYMRAINTSSEYRNKVWFDSVCMEQTAPPPPPASPSPSPTGPYFRYLPYTQR